MKHIKSKRRSKFNVSQTKKGKQNRTYNDICFDSELEMKYYKDVICVGLEDGSIKDCLLQIKYELQPKFKYMGSTILPINYIADFVITYKDGHVEVHDTKGLPDSTATIKKKIFHYVYPDVIYKWIGFSKKDGGWLEYKDIKKARAKRKKEKSIK